jgi:hypothetical protein
MDHTLLFAVASIVISQAATALALLRISLTLRSSDTATSKSLGSIADSIDRARAGLGLSAATNATSLKTSIDRAVARLESIATQQHSAQVDPDK